MVRLSVPYISQLIGGTGGNNCGPACLSMQLANRGVIPATQDAMLEVADIARDGVSDNRGETGGYITYNQLTMVANMYGQQTQYVYNWDELNQKVRQGEPVTVLLDNTVLTPRQYPVSSGWNAHHFILLTSNEEEDGNTYSSDPLSYYIGGPYFYTTGSTKQGINNLGGLSTSPGQCLVPLDGPPPEPPPKEQIMLMEDWQIKNWVLSDLYQWAGIPYNPEAGTAQAWVLALRDGVYLGRPRTEERGYGEGDMAGCWVEFDHGVLFFRFSDGQYSVRG
jgi:hypothetical protein